MITQMVAYSTLISFNCSLADKQVIVMGIALFIMATIAAALVGSWHWGYRTTAARSLTCVVAVATAWGMGTLYFKQPFECQAILVNENGQYVQDVYAFKRPSNGISVMLTKDKDSGRVYMSEMDPLTSDKR